MSADRHSEFLPRSRGARVGVAVLAIPSFLILLSFLIAFPTVYIPWPPKSIDEAIALIAICELLAAGCLFTLLAFIWSVATPRWLETALESGARRLVTMVGFFLVITGANVAVVMIALGVWVPAVLMLLGIILGVHLLRVASRPGWPRDRREIGE